MAFALSSKPRLLLCLSSLAIALAGMSSPLAAQDTPADPAEEKKDANPYPPTADIGDMAGLAKAGNDAWAKGDFKTAVGNFTALLGQGIKTSTKPADLEELYFYIALCYFNIPDHERAEKTFNEYISKYATGRWVSRAGLGLARVYAAQKKWAEAAAKYDKIKNEPSLKELKDDIYIELANSWKENQQVDKAVSLLETALTPGIKTEGDVRQALFLVNLYRDSPADGSKEKAVKTLDRIKRAPGAMPMVAEVNYVALTVADALMDGGKPEAALEAYQNIRKQKEVVAMMESVIGVYERQLAFWKARAGAKTGDANNPAAQQKSAMAQEMVSRYNAQLDGSKKQLETITKEKTYDAIVFFRIGRCFLALERFWEANIAFKFVLENFPSFEDKETVQFGQLVSFYKLTPPLGTPDGLKMGEETEKLAKRYLADYKNSAQTQEVASLLVDVVQRRGDPAGTNAIFDDVLGLLGDSPQKANFMAMQVQNYLEVFNFDKAREAADAYLEANPNADPLERETVDYMRALTWFFKNDYKGTIEQLDLFEKTYPTSRHLADLKYRRAIVNLGEERQRKGKREETNFKKIVDECKSIATSYPESPTVGDAWALTGDALKDMPGAEVERVYDKGRDSYALRDKDQCEAYMNATRLGASGEVIEYGMTSARPLLAAMERWVEYEALHRDFVTRFPEHRLYSDCIKEVSKAIKRQAPPVTDEDVEKAYAAAIEKAKRDSKNPADIRKEAVRADLITLKKNEQNAKVREFLASEIKKMIDLPQKEGVEDLVQQLAIDSLPPKRKPTAPGAAAPAPVVTTTPGTPAVPPKPDLYTVQERYDLASKEMDRLLVTDRMTDVARARIEFTKIKLLEYLESTAPKKRGPDGKYVVETGPKESEVRMKKLVAETKSEDLSSTLLANIGDYLMQQGGQENREKAAGYYNRLTSFFPNSLFLDYAAVGLGQIAMDDGDLKLAYRKFVLATDEVPGGKYGEAQIGKVRCLIQFTNEADLKEITLTRSEALTKVEEILKEIIGDKSYPPETKAEAHYLLGKAKVELKDDAAAFNYFQRLYVSFGKFPSWVAKGYLEAGQAKERLNKLTEALNVYQEAQTERIAPKIKDQPEFQKLVERFKALSGATN